MELLTTYRECSYYTPKQWSGPVTGISTDDLLRQRLPAGTVVKCLSQDGDSVRCKIVRQIVHIHREAFVKRRKRRR